MFSLWQRLGIVAEETSRHYETMVVFHRRMDGTVPPNSVLFIGDSFIQSLCVSAVTERGVNLGIGGDTTLGVLRRLPLYRCTASARVVVLNVGCNDLPLRSNQGILNAYKKIVSEIPSGPNVLICAVCPVDEGLRPERPNRRIRELNDHLRGICASTSRCAFLEVPDSLLDESGNLRRDCHEGVGIHLSSRGYAVWIEALCKAVEESEQ